MLASSGIRSYANFDCTSLMAFYICTASMIESRLTHAKWRGCKKETRSKENLDLPWQVVVHNDPVNLMTYVTMVFQRVFGYPREKAESHMLEVHHKGRSVLWSGMRERAELYVQQLHGYLLLATLEKAS